MTPPASSATPPAPPAADRPIQLDFRVAARTNGGEREIRSGDTLRSGDRVALRVKVSEPAYVYVGLAAASGKESVIAPSDDPLPPGVEHRIPAAGQWLKLTRKTGREDFFLYASRTRLTKEQSLRLVREDSARERPSKKPAPVPGPSDASAPIALNEANRDLEFAADEDAGNGAKVRTGKDLTRAHFLIKHAK